MDFHVLRQSSHVHVEVFVVPLEAGGCERVVRQVVAVFCRRCSLFHHEHSSVRILFLVCPVVVGEHLDAVFLSWQDVRCEFEAERHDPVLVDAQPMAVEPHLCALSCSLKFDEHMLSSPFGWSLEPFHIPACVVRKLCDVHAVCPVLIPCSWQCDGALLPRVQNSLFWIVQLPVSIEIEGLPLCFRTIGAYKQ